MLQEQKVRTNWGVAIGLILQVVGRFVAYSSSDGVVILGKLWILIGVGVFIWGCMNYAEGKGYSKWLGCLGLLNIFGLAILVVLHDKHKAAK